MSGQETAEIVDLPPPALRRLAVAIRRARERRGWSLRTLAEAASLNHEVVRRIEAAQADPRFSVFARLTLALDLTEELPQIILGQKKAAPVRDRKAK